MLIEMSQKKWGKQGVIFHASRGISSTDIRTCLGSIYCTCISSLYFIYCIYWSLAMNSWRKKKSIIQSVPWSMPGQHFTFFLYHPKGQTIWVTLCVMPGIYHGILKLVLPLPLQMRILLQMCIGHDRPERRWWWLGPSRIKRIWI